ncbi:MAG: hypothetical protein JO092_06115 [Candidatus Eremiobacteraeota bacterium]|nr:hypothetical protein [Candidatus Eremiobacteraeota bacterium]
MSDPHRRKLRYAVVLDRLRSWQLRCIQALEASDAATLEAIIEVGDEACPFFEQPRSQQVVELPENLRTRTPFMRAGETALHALQLDFVLQLTQSRPPPEIVNAARYGIWYFNFSDGSRFTSRTPYFWEIYRDHDVSAAMLLRAGPNGDSLGTVLAAGYFPTIRTSYAQNVDQCFFRSAGWPAKVCRELVTLAVTPAGSTLPLPVETYGVPNFFARLGCTLRMLRARAFAFAHNFLRPYWNIARVRLPQAGGGKAREVQLLVPDSVTDYFADPFAYQSGGRRYVFFERFSYLRNRGNISFLELGAEAQPQLVTAIEEPEHMSYPQVFEWAGTTYCVPETSKANEVRIYKAVRFPHEWVLAGVILRGFPAVDPTLHRWRDRWWLFCTKYGEGQASDLYLWHADDLFGPWKEHARNPVKVDVRSARPAGRLFTRNEALYRPAQDCSRSYGGRLSINKISKLSETEFAEAVDGIVEPPPSGSYRYGLHTIDFLGDATIVDLKRVSFSTLATRRYFGVRIRSALNALGVSDAQIDRVKNSIRR